jgi:hypothetical protein
VSARASARRSGNAAARIEATLTEREAWLREQARLSRGSRAQTVRDLEDLGNREEATQRDYAGRYPIELLQNAHDACSDARVQGRVRFELTSTALLVANEGEPFDAKRVRSLVRQGTSEKADQRRRRTIGYKGVGFSSVFEVSRTPQVIGASGLAFGFDRARARALVRSHLRIGPRTVAARNFPFRLEPGDWRVDAQHVARLLDAGFATVIRLPLREDQSPDRVWAHLKTQLVPETLIFLPSVDRLECQFGDASFSARSARGHASRHGRIVHVDTQDGERVSWIVRSASEPVSPEVVEALEDPAWRDVDALRLTVGLPWRRRRVDPDAPEMPLHVYFPTSERTGRSCLVHADFCMDSSRSQILLDGPAGEINRIAADGIARLLRELAEGLAATQAGEVLAALAKTGDPSSFGQVLNERLCAELRTARLGRPADGGAPVRLAELRLITADLAIDLDERLMQLMSRRKDLVLVRDMSHRRSVATARELGVGALTPTDAAARVTLHNSRLSYRRGLQLIGDWLEKFSWSEADPIIAALRARRILRDSDGRWHRPNDAVLAGAGVPRLPEALRLVEIPAVGDDVGHVLEWLEVEALDASIALQTVDAALDDGRFGDDDAERQQLHDWLLALWRSSAALFDAATPVLQGRAPVRVTRADGSDAGWGSATEAYFGGAWTDVGHALEVLYGPDDRREFLALEAGGQRLAGFYRAIGVATAPRRHDRQPPSGALTSSWWLQPEVRTASVCPSGEHVQSHQQVSSVVWDRLDAMLERASAADDAADALAELVVRVPDAVGPPATFRCTHSGHRNKARARSVKGYQRWRLEEAAWLPVVQDPSGASRRQPSATWHGIRGPARRLLLPRPARRELDAPGLGLVSWDRPDADQVEEALAALRDAFPDLSQAPPEAAETADRLLQRLEGALAGQTETRDAIELPARIGRRRAWAWSDEAYVADVPGLESVEGVPITDVVLTSRVRHAYGLRPLSEAVTQHVHPGRPTTGKSLLPFELRSDLVVLVAREHGNREQVAERLATLSERNVLTIDVEVVVANQSTEWRRDVLFALVPGDRATELFVTPEVRRRPLQLAHVLADYLGAGEHTRLIALMLTTPAELSETVLDGEREEAEALLRRSWTDHADTDGAHDEIEAAGIREEDDANARSSDSSPAQTTTQEFTTAAADPQGREPPKNDDEPAVSERERAQPASERAPSEDEAADGRRQMSRPRRDGSSTFQTTEPRSPVDARWRGDGPDRNGGESAPTVDASRASFGAPTVPDFPDRAASQGGAPSNGGPAQRDGLPQAFGRASGTPRSDEEVERVAVELVSRYAREVLGVVEIRDRQAERIGWDLEFLHGDGRTELVEVKGSGGGGPFGLTVNELGAARRYDDYVLYFVADVRTERPLLYRFDDLGSRVRDEHLSPASYWVSGWRELEPVLVEIHLPV